MLESSPALFLELIFCSTPRTGGRMPLLRGASQAVVTDPAEHEGASRHLSGRASHSAGEQTKKIFGGADRGNPLNLRSLANSQPVSIDSL